MSDNHFQLQRYYFGLLQGQADAKPAILARTPDIRAEHVTEALRVGRLEPPSVVSEAMPASMGLFRGDSVDYILTIAQINEAGNPQLLYIPLEMALIRQLGGNLNPFMALAHNPMPLFSETRHNLTPFALDDPHPLEKNEQLETIEALLLYCQDNMKIVDGILTALVEGRNIAIINAPLSLDERIKFVEGLTTLLPPPARGIITLATHVTKPDQSTAQIKYIYGTVPPADHVIFNWEANTLTPDNLKRHDYARFVVSQLRLDPEQAIEHTERLARTASWRAIRKDNLATALHWVSRRAKVDSAVQAGQPADRETVADILRSDPTLTDELRVVYSKHLVSFSLALNEWKTTDSIPAIAAGHRDVAEGISLQLREMITQEHAVEVYNLIEHWLVEVPDSHSLPWQSLLHLAATTYIQKLIATKNAPELVKFLYRMCNVRPILQIDKIADTVMSYVRPIAAAVSQLAQAVFIFAADHLPAGGFQDLVSEINFVKRLPVPLQQAIVFLQPEVNPSLKPPAQVLSRAVATIPPDYQILVMVRLIEVALYLRRGDLISERELQTLIRLPDTPLAERFGYVIRYLVEEFSQLDRIKPLSPTSLVLLPQLYFLIGNTSEGIKLLEFYQNSLFTVERLNLFSELLEQVFLKAKFPQAQMLAALAAFEGSQIRPEVRVRAYSAALINQNWVIKMEPVALELTKMIVADYRVIPIITIKHTLRLLKFHVDHLNMPSAIKLGDALVMIAARIGAEGPPLLVTIWQVLTAKVTEARPAILELLRRYVRLLPPEESIGLPKYFSEQIEAEVGEALKATRLVRVITGGRNFLQLAEVLHLAKALLRDLAITYQDSKERPPLHRLRRDLDAMAGGVNEVERQNLSNNIDEITHLVYVLGTQQSPALKKTGANKAPTRVSSKSTSVRSILKEARSLTPQTAIEFLSWLGLCFTDSFVLDLNLEREEASHVLGVRSATMFYRETFEIRELLHNLFEAFPDDDPPVFSADTLRSEIDSLWATIDLYNQRRIQADLAQDSQELSLLLRIVAARATDRILNDRGLGKQLESGKRLPDNELEALRWISGYFARKHER